MYSAVWNVKTMAFQFCDTLIQQNEEFENCVKAQIFIVFYGWYGLVK